MVTQPDDRTLVENYLKGERAAIRKVERIIDLAFIPFQRRLGHSADDIKQDVHISLLKSFRENQFRFESSLKVYIGRVVAHRALGVIEFNKLREYQDLDDPANECAGDGDDPEEALLRKEHWTRIVWVIRKSSKECRRLLRQVLRQGLDYAEIAQRENIEVGTVKWRVSECRKHARSLLEKLENSSNLFSLYRPKLVNGK